MKAINSLKDRLTSKDTLVVQNEGGFVREIGFEWREPATDSEIKEFEITYNIKLPSSFREFLKISNGATLYKDIEYGQWGCHICGLDELIERTKYVHSWGYDIKPSWIVYATWLGDCDILIFDLERYINGEKDYIIDGEQGESIDEWCIIKGDFIKWLDRLIVSQGAKYWRWY